MKIRKVGKMTGAQDGAIFGSELFRFTRYGGCRVYNLEDIDPSGECEMEPTAKFTLDRTDVIMPHCNSVCFGTEYYQKDDEYPLLYANVYNNYAKEEDKRVGICCVYRIFRNGDEFGSELLQLIEIGFCKDSELWRAYPDEDGPRPYGNFLVDRERGYYYAFVMRCVELGTRYFKFKLPSARDGEIDPRYGVRRVVLGAEDILESFDCPYHRYIQGATLHNGKIYSTEGFRASEVNRPVIRIIDLERGEQESVFDLLSMGYVDEVEMIDFYKGTCYYSDADGVFYSVDFD